MTYHEAYREECKSVGRVGLLVTTKKDMLGPKLDIKTCVAGRIKGANSLTVDCPIDVALHPALKVFGNPYLDGMEHVTIKTLTKSREALANCEVQLRALCHTSTTNKAMFVKVVTEEASLAQSSNRLRCLLQILCIDILDESSGSDSGVVMLRVIRAEAHSKIIDALKAREVRG